MLREKVKERQRERGEGGKEREGGSETEMREGKRVKRGGEEHIDRQTDR